MIRWVCQTLDGFVRSRQNTNLNNASSRIEPHFCAYAIITIFASPSIIKNHTYTLVGISEAAVKRGLARRIDYTIRYGIKL